MGGLLDQGHTVIVDPLDDEREGKVCGIIHTFALTQAKSLELFLIARLNFKGSV